MKYYTNINLVNPTVIICSKGKQHNYVCIFRSYILFYMIFRSPRHFLRILFKSKEKKNQIPALGQDLAGGLWPYGPSNDLRCWWGFMAERTGLAGQAQ
jgi:hypothetical protein